MRNLKILGLSLLALVGVLAVSASAAQAKWLILEKGSSIPGNSIQVDVKTTEEGALLVEELGLNIECKEGKGGITATLSEEGKVLTGKGTVTFTSCKDPGFEEVCTVSSEGAAAGSIVANGEGNLSMTGDPELVVGHLSSKAGKPFTKIVYSGEECPLSEVDGTVTGELLVCVLKALKDEALHVGHVIAQKLQYGESAATLEGDVNGVNPLLSISGVGGATYAIHLVNL